MRIGTGISHGTFGELVQGVLDNRPFLITLPVPSLRSKAIFTADPAVSDILGFPANSKAMKACIKLFQIYGIKEGGHLSIQSTIPVGKGMASSSADITASLRAVANAYALPLSAEVISAVASEIEPTDGVMYDGIVAFDYIQGELIESLGSLPPFSILGIDLGGVIDTVQFNQSAKFYDSCDQEKFKQAYEQVSKGLRQRNLSLVCEAATISARINQKILPKPFFAEFEKWALDFRGGLVVAHSGTVLGILLDQRKRNADKVILQLTKQIELLARKSNFKMFSYISGEINDQAM